MIDSKLQLTDRTFGRNVLAVELETSFAVSGLDKKDAQRFVYSNIVNSLEGRGFDVGMYMDTHITTLYIAYTVRFTDTLVGEMNNILQRTRLRTQNDIDSFKQKPHPGAVKYKNTPTN
jgi:hypothetical protein